MTRTIVAGLLVAAGAACLLAAPPVAAQADSEVVARLQQLLQEATRARARLERDNASLKREVQELEAQVESLQASEKKLEGRLERSQTRAAALEQAGEDWKARYGSLRDGWNKLLGGCTETVYIMRDIERERGVLAERLAARNASLAACAEANDELLALNEEILSRYEEDGQGGVFSSVAKREPFVRLTRARLHNAIDDYRFEAGEYDFRSPDDLPVLDEAAAAMTLEGRWSCRLMPQALDGL